MASGPSPGRGSLGRSRVTRSGVRIPCSFGGRFPGYPALVAAPPSQGDQAQAGGPLAAIMRGATVALLGSILGGGLGFVFLVVMARLMDQHDFGLLVLAVNFLLAGAVLALAGFDYATVRYVAAADTPGRKRGAMLTPLRLVLALNAIVALTIFVLAEPIAEHVLAQPEFTNALRALALVLPLAVAAQALSAALSGLERAQGELARKVVEQGGRIALAPVGLALGLGVAGAVLGMAAAAALAAIVVAFLLWRALPRGGKTERLPAREVVAFSWPQAVANGAGQLWELGNVVILSHYAGGRAVALYGAAIAIARLPALIYNSFAYRFSPAISRLWERGERSELGELLQSVTRLVTMFAVPLYAVAIALPAPLLLIYGSDYADAAVPLAMIAAGSLFNSLTGPVETALIMTGRVRLEMAVNVIAAMLVVAVSLVLTPRYGVEGAAGAVMVYSLVLNGLKAIVLRWRVGLQTLSSSLLGPLAAGAVVAGAAAALEPHTSLADSLPGAAVLGLGVVALYALLLVRVIGISPLDRQAIWLAVRSAR